MRHHNYYNRRNWQSPWGRGVIGFSPRRLSQALAGEGVELRLAYIATRLPEKDRCKRALELNGGSR